MWVLFVSNTKPIVSRPRYAKTSVLLRLRDSVSAARQGLFITPKIAALLCNFRSLLVVCCFGMRFPMKAAPILAFGSLLLTQTFGQVAPTEANLRAAAASGGVTKFSGDGTISLATPVAINTDTTIDADGHAIAIDGGNLTTLFQVSATGNLTLKGLALVNGRVKGADSPNDGGGAAGSVGGGAIQNSGGEVTAISCTFSNN